MAADAEAKAAARTAQTVVETLSTDQGASYAGIDAQAVAQLEPSLAGADLTVTGEKTSYAVTATSSSGVEFTIDRSGGAVEYTCEPAGTGGCPAGGDWS